jgi:glycosyltransferase 2 family protein
VRKFIFILVLFLAIGFLIASFAEVQEIATIFRSGEWKFIGLAVAVELLWLLNVGFSYQVIYKIIGIEESRGRMLLLAATALFVNTVAPAVAGAPSIAIFLADGRRRGHQSGRVMVAWATFLVFDYIGLLLAVLLALIVLFRRNHVGWVEVVSAAVLLLIAITLVTVLYLGMKGPKKLGALLAWVTRLINRIYRVFAHKDLLKIERAYSLADEISEGMHTLRAKPRELFLPMLLAFSNKALLIMILALIFLAFSVQFTIGTLLAGFGMFYLFVIVSPTPNGIGVVEGMMPFTLSALRVPFEAATVVTLAFRGITFWLPFLIGMLSFRMFSEGKRNLKEELN